MSENQEDTTLLEYLVTGLVILSFGLLYLFLNHGWNFWPGADKVSGIAVNSGQAVQTERTGIASLLGLDPVGTATVDGAATVNTATVNTDLDTQTTTDTSTVTAETTAATTAATTAVAATVAAPAKAIEAAPASIAQVKPSLQDGLAAKVLETDQLKTELTGLKGEVARLEAEKAELQRIQSEQKQVLDAALAEAEAEVKGTPAPAEPAPVVAQADNTALAATLEKAIAEKRTNASMILDGITFEAGSSKLSARSQPQIDMIANQLSKHKDARILIRGHTDNTGTVTDNSLLSLSRSGSMKRALMALGIDSNRIKVEGVGPLEPIASNDTESGREKNRRIELLIIE